jgi:hypothetical protein
MVNVGADSLVIICTQSVPSPYVMATVPAVGAFEMVTVVSLIAVITVPAVIPVPDTVIPTASPTLLAIGNVLFVLFVAVMTTPESTLPANATGVDVRELIAAAKFAAVLAGADPTV